MNYTRDNNGKFSAIPKDDPRDRVSVEIGDTKQPTFQPQSKVMRWDNEANVSIRHINHGEQHPTVVQEGDVVKWIGSNREIHYYDLSISDTHPEGANEQEIRLLEKPTSNVMEFSIASKGVDFHLQPALTQAEIDQGAVRPDHVVGSYAICTSDQKRNYIGGKEYKAGKVGHIYRPWIMDANGAGVWGALSISVNPGGIGTLTVTIPQEFLDTAVYPVRHAAGLTFGYTTIGGTSVPQSSGSAMLSKATGSAGTVSTISAYGDRGSSAGARSAKGVLFQVSDGTVITNGVSPALVWSATTGSPVWNTMTYSSQPTVSAINYYVSAIITSDDVFHFYYDTGSSGIGGVSSNNYATPATIGTISADTRQYSIYATYTATVAAIGIRPFF